MGKRKRLSLLLHTLMHLEHNRINEETGYESDWYCGNKKQFQKRHSEAIEYIKSLIAADTTPKESPNADPS